MHQNVIVRICQKTETDSFVPSYVAFDEAIIDWNVAIMPVHSDSFRDLINGNYEKRDPNIYHVFMIIQFIQAEKPPF